jgi:hypothetical protein
VNKFLRKVLVGAKKICDKDIGWKQQGRNQKIVKKQAISVFAAGGGQKILPLAGLFPKCFTKVACKNETLVQN